MGRTRQAVLIILYALMTVKAFEMEIIPANRVVAQIGETLVLTCNSTGCASPSFSWRTQMDNPLGGTVNNHRTYSTLTMNPVSIVNSHHYLCTVFCGEKEKKEKSIKVELYSFPSDPVIEISPSLVAGKPVSVLCKIPDVYPSDRLEVLLKKEEHVLHEENFYTDDSTNTETKTVKYSFTLTAEDIGKEITCVAKLPIANMDFEPKERVASQKLNANFGPQNTVITASPGSSPMEGDHLKLTCVTESNPPPQIVWRKHLADESIQHLVENNVLSIPHARSTDSGLYICEVINLVTNKTEKATVDIVVQGVPSIAELSIEPSTTVQEGENVSIHCSAESNPPPKIILRRKSDRADMGSYSDRRILLLPSVTFLNSGDYECVAENKFGKTESAITLNVEYGPKNTMISVIPANTVKEGETVTMKCTSSGNPAPVISWKKKKATGESEKISEDATLIVQNVKSQDLGLYECEAYNQFGKEEKVVKLLVQGRLEKTDQMIPLIIAFSCVTAVAVPVVAIWIYVSRKAKINGSYSLVKALRLKVMLNKEFLGEVEGIWFLLALVLIKQYAKPLPWQKNQEQQLQPSKHFEKGSETPGGPAAAGHSALSTCCCAGPALQHTLYHVGKVLCMIFQCCFCQCQSKYPSQQAVEEHTSPAVRILFQMAQNQPCINHQYNPKQIKI
ncbi:vascular cell adhesion protein 1 isoform B [Patagioenas fasciata monilis]|uniref:Vascular cell adhesion protein 1 isoform B n=1 Tax=Patagioenas fasciata monilis TaxID=372326 RepID=A0A1V4K046_PATFA|nr:vascular cell adhesion protein 1 isoform B [Patagioenas fasciata monilis]